MRTKKFYTVKQWSKFKSNDYFDMQEMLCQKYDVVLIDYQTKKQKTFSLFQKINLKNFDKGITEFAKLVQSFGGSMDRLTREIDSQTHKDKDNLDSIWSKSANSVPIWSTSENNSDSQSQHKANLEKIWGKKK
jgi:hypothetical protein